MKRRIFNIALDKNALFEVAHKYGKVKIEGARGKKMLFVKVSLFANVTH